MPNTIYCAGGGCSLIVIDMDARTTFAYAVDKMEPVMIADDRSFRLIEAMWQAFT